MAKVSDPVALKRPPGRHELDPGRDGQRQPVGTGRARRDRERAPDRSDLDDWREAWQQAIDAGYRFGDQLLEELSPPAEDEDDDEPADVPAGFDPRSMARTGIAVLENGLPPLPDVLTRHMAVPMAGPPAKQPPVLFLRFHRHRRAWDTWAIVATFTRQDGQWTATGTHWHGTDFHDPSPTPAAAAASAGKPSSRAAPAVATVAPSCAAPQRRP